MRIAVNARFLLKGNLEGLGWYSHEVLRRMVLSHPEDEFHFIFDRPFDASFIYAKNVIPHVISPPARHPLLWYLWFEWALPRALKKINPDVFFSPDGYVSLKSPFKTVLTVHDIIPLHHPEQVPFLARKYYQYFLPKYIQRANKIIAISNHVKSDLIKTCDCLSTDISVAYNGIRSEFMPLPAAEKRVVKAKYSEGKPYFFYTGSINARKNIDRLILAFDAFKKATKSDAKLLIAGKKGWEIEPVDTAMANVAFASDVLFLGYVSNEEQVRLMASATFFTYLSLEEGFGLPLLEAMACGIPVLASDIAVFREVAENAAFYINPKDVTAISTAMIDLMADRAYLHSKDAAAKIRVDVFSWDTAADTVARSLGLET